MNSNQNASAAMASETERGAVDESFVRAAIDQANLNALRLALYQVTKDPDLAKMRVRKQAIRGGALYGYVLAEEDHDEFKAKALAYLLKGPHRTPPPPSKEDTRPLMDLFSDKPVSDASFQYGYEELAYDEFPRDVTWTKRPSPEKLAVFKVVVIGGGISGIAAAIQLKRLGIPFTVIERQAGIGGTWLLNTYPEARVDTSSYLYQFKFEKNYPWTEFFASRAETQKYLEHIANKYGVKSDFQFNREVVAGRWDEPSSHWILSIKRKDGGEETVSANVLISGSGLFSTPNLPKIPGIADFKGAIFHTAQWDHTFDYRGKRAALIGTGSTGTQLAPGLAREVKSLIVFQRTPNWIMAMENYRGSVTPQMRWLFDTMPYYWNWHCYASYFTAEQLQGLQTYDPEWQKSGGKINERNDGLRANLTEYIRSKVGDDEELFAKLLPKHAPMVRRLVVDNGFYDTLRRDNVDLVTEGIERIIKTGILTRDGTEHEFDLIVLGAGFKASQYLWPVNYVGRNGIQLQDGWKKDGARAYLGTAMPGFPNLFMFYGPNGQPRSGGFYSWAEIWARYTIGAIVSMLETDAKSMEVRQDVFDDYNARLDEATKQLIWEAEGHGYYVNEHGRSAANMPWTTTGYHTMVLRPNLEDYEVR
jgi:4-hydroxyacetophenone monooxygenase